jgi:dTDP-4-dehydrorhamnose 3,5-epimerase
VGECAGRTDSPSFRQVMDFLTGDYQPARALKIPPGIAHGCKNVQRPINFIDVRSRVYDLADEIHIANDDPEIAFDLLRRPEIS